MSPVHKAKGKPGNRCSKEDNPGLVALQNHFLELEDLGESVAIRIVCEVTGKVTESDNNDNTVHLPMCCRSSLSMINSVKITVGHATQQAKATIR